MDLGTPGWAMPSARMKSLLARCAWALVTDNASVVVTMRQEAESSGLVEAAYGCFEHATNLLAEDICRLDYVALP